MISELGSVVGAPPRQEAERLLTGTQLEVRRGQCTLCWAPPLSACQRYPRGDHLQRWLDAAVADRITKAELAATISLIVIMHPHDVIPDSAVRAT